MRIITIFLAGVFCFLNSFSDAKAEWPTYIEKTVAAGKVVSLISLRQYQAERGCTATPAGQFDGSPKPKFGSLISTDRTVLSDGPCGKMEYSVQSIGYKAGLTPGVDEFELYIFPSAFYGGSPWRIKTKITVGNGRQDSEKPVVRNEKAVKPSERVVAEKKVDAAPVQPKAPAKQSPELPAIDRSLVAAAGTSIRVGYAYDLNPDCSVAGDIVMRLVTPPKFGSVRLEKEPGFSRYAKNDRRFECNSQRVDVMRIYYDAPQAEANDAFAVDTFYANGNVRRFNISVSVK
jgi:hypothetical protein